MTKRRSRGARVDRVLLRAARACRPRRNCFQADVLEGKAFGDAGAYEKIAAKIQFRVEAGRSAQQSVVDLDQAGGTRPEKSSRLGLLSVASEGWRRARAFGVAGDRSWGKGLLALFRAEIVARSENGRGVRGRILDGAGVTVAWIGWQWDVRAKTGNDAPIRAGCAAGDKPITGLVAGDFTVTKESDEHPLGHVISGTIGGTEYFCSDPKTRKRSTSATRRGAAPDDFAKRWALVGHRAKWSRARERFDEKRIRTGKDLPQLLSRTRSGNRWLGIGGGARLCLLSEARPERARVVEPRLCRWHFADGRFLSPFSL